jgi:hypothetical protein
MTILQQSKWVCFCSHGDGPDLAAPPESQGSNEDYLRQPCGKERNPRWAEKVMRRRRSLIRFFYPYQKMLYKHMLSGPNDEYGP